VSANKAEKALIEFAHRLTGARWYVSSSYEISETDRVNAAIAECKNEIGEALLEALKAAGVVIPEAEEVTY
jgi:hypothetical protein